MSNPNPSNQSSNSELPIPLFQVLIEEYNHQQVGPPYPSGLTEEERAKALQEKIKKYNDVLKDDSLNDDEKEAERKRINSDEVKEFYKHLYMYNVKRSALCFSGGGIRSATFGLGILQGLARKGLLKQFDFLSTVSGGGYLGSWLSAWIHRKGLEKVDLRLKNARPPSPLQPEPDAISHLRTYSNYMSPKVGLLSADTWTLVAIFFRNLILNWLVLFPLILLVLMIPRICVAAIRYTPERRLPFVHYLPEWVKNIIYWFAPNAPKGGSGAFWVAVLFGIISIAYIYVNRPSLADSHLRWESKPGSIFPNKLKTQGWFLVLCLVPLLLLAVLITTYYAWIGKELKHVTFNLNVESLGIAWPFPPTLAFIIFGVMLNLGGLLISFLFRRDFRIGDNISEILIAIFSGGVGGALTWLIADKVFASQTASPLWAASYVCFAAPAFLTLFLLAATVFVGASSRFTSDPDREWLARAGAWVIIASVAWCLISVIVIFGPMLLVYGIKTAIASISFGTLSGVFTLLLGHSDRTSPKGKKSSGMSDIILMIAAPLFAIFILICLSLLTSWLIVELPGGFDIGKVSNLPKRLMDVVYNAPLPLLLIMFLAFLVIGLLASWFVNINKFSLHAAYRDRLIRAYLGASRIEEERKPNPFTGLDEKDNLQMQQLRTQLFHDGNVRKTIKIDGSKIPDFTLLIEKLRRAGELKKSDGGTNGGVSIEGGENEAAVSASLWDCLSERTQRFIRPMPQDEPPTRAQLAYSLLNDLNYIIQGESIYDEKIFPRKENLPTDIQKLIEQEPCVETLRLNRRLLELTYPETFAPAGPCKPLHIINITLNLVGGKNLAWQDRQAESFTVSALHSGSYCVGYRDSNIYGLNYKKEAITLGTALAISGAAASPNMGYYSSTFVTFLLALFNVRLGWWLGNPGLAGNGRMGQSTYDTPGPRLAARPIIEETLGLTDDERPYVYLSDGGHFENFGLYEMVLRRCHFIVVSDGSADPNYSYEGLGNAISKIRVDMGVPIKFESYLILPEDNSGRGQKKRPAELPKHKYCAMARICYSCVDAGAEDGYLIYIKTALSGSESIDVYNYAQSHPAFPHESTADQMYSESQFESYRELGSHVIENICRSMHEGHEGETAAEALNRFFNSVEVEVGERLPGC